MYMCVLYLCAFVHRVLCACSTWVCFNTARVYICLHLQGLCMSFMSQVARDHHTAVTALCQNHLKLANDTLKAPLLQPSDARRTQVEGYWLPIGGQTQNMSEKYILTPSVRDNLRNLARIISARSLVEQCTLPRALSVWSPPPALHPASCTQCVVPSAHPAPFLVHSVCGPLHPPCTLPRALSVWSPPPALHPSSCTQCVVPSARPAPFLCTLLLSSSTLLLSPPTLLLPYPPFRSSNLLAHHLAFTHPPLAAIFLCCCKVPPLLAKPAWCGGWQRPLDTAVCESITTNTQTYKSTLECTLQITQGSWSSRKVRA